MLKPVVHITLISLFLLAIAACTADLETRNDQTSSIDAAYLAKVISYLASDELQGRMTGSDGIEKAAVLIEDEFISYGLKPYFKTFRDTFLIDTDRAFNLVGLIEGNDQVLKNQFIIISAHYDHLGLDKNASDDQIFNGANDNASGTAAVMSIAKHFSQLQNNKRSIIFALFSAEELGKLGSQHLAKKLKTQNLDIYTLINLEMLGVPRQDKQHTAYITGFEKSNLAEIINHYSKKNTLSFSEQAKNNELFKRSDNYPFYKTFNIPAHTITSFEFQNYPQYHEASDEVDKLDYAHMTNLLNELILGIEGLVNSPTKEITLNEK